MRLGRRQFLSGLMITTAGLAVDPEQLLWEPGKKVIFDLWTPPSNTILTVGQITREALRVLQNNLEFTHRVNLTYDEKFGRGAVGAMKIGTNVHVRKPSHYMLTNEGIYVDRWRRRSLDAKRSVRP